MQALEHKMAFNRLSVKLLLAVTVLVALSWGIMRVRSSAQAPVLVELASAGQFERPPVRRRTRSSQACRPACAVGRMIGAALSQLGLAYLQKARETGDPAYYPKVEGVLREALKRQPDDYAATGGMGALALARHDFHAALDWGQAAVRTNSYRSYGYGVLADAEIELGRYDEAERTLQTIVDQRPDPSAYARAFPTCASSAATCQARAANDAVGRRWQPAHR